MAVSGEADLAKKPKSAKSSKPAKARTPKDVETAVVDAALKLAAQLGWREVTLADIADAAGVDRADLYRTLPSKTAIVAAFMRRTDEAVIAGGTADFAEETAKDRLFDVCMRRFDALQVNRDAVAAICRDLPADPLALACLICPRVRSMRWMLESANIGSDGVLGLVRRKGLNMILLSTMRVWLNDDSRDMSATMAHLDKLLGRADRLIGNLRDGFSRPGETAAEA